MNSLAKTCSHCERVLPVGSFNRRGADRLQAWCNGCKAEANRKYPAPPRMIPCSYCGQVHERRVLRSSRSYYCSPKCRARACTLRHKYHIEPEELRSMWDRQGGTCAMPGCPNSLSLFGARGHHVDHDHATGRVRGLLCHRCNCALGGYEHVIALGAADYLKG